MRKNRIRLSESDLHRIVEASVRRVIAENEMDEGWFGDKWNQVKGAANTAYTNLSNGNNLRGTFNNTRANWQSQGELNDINNLRNMLTKLIDDRKISPNTTVAQLVGGKYNNRRFGTITGMAANRRSAISQRGGQAY